MEINISTYCQHFQKIPERYFTVLRKSETCTSTAGSSALADDALSSSPDRGFPSTSDAWDLAANRSLLRTRYEKYEPH